VAYFCLVISLQFIKIINLFALNLTALSDFTIIELNTIDSTNNYAMQLIDANKAQHGLTIVAQTQTGGKGQRGKEWTDNPGESLLMSIILTPNNPVREQFVFNGSVAVAIANVLQKLYKNWSVHIKWTNDMIINDKKAGGILIENVLRGNNWTHSVVGIGLNIKQDRFPDDLPFATSLKMASGIDFDIKDLRGHIIESVMSATSFFVHGAGNMNLYNALLYNRGKKQRFSDISGEWGAMIINAHADGTLELKKDDGAIVFCHHGQAEWVWGKAAEL
jgi:BirA family biotin operon repressor/biotin-[acetyl-CoA-carboxylase] ligase